MLNTLKFILLMSIVVWVGSLIFFTFFVAPSIFKVLPGELAGELVKSLFPKYWAIGYISGILSLAALLGISFIEKGFPAARILILSLMTALTFYSGMVIAPKAEEVREKAKQIQDPVKKEELGKEFKKLHFESYAFNMAVLVSGITFVLFTARNTRL